jgi:hypothetical protein
VGGRAQIMKDGGNRVVRDGHRTLHPSWSLAGSQRPLALQAPAESAVSGRAQLTALFYLTDVVDGGETTCSPRRYCHSTLPLAVILWRFTQESCCHCCHFLPKIMTVSPWAR